MACSIFRPGLPSITLYGDGARMIMNFIDVLRLNPSFPKRTSRSIFPKGFATSPAKPTKSVLVSLSPALTFSGSGSLTHHPVIMAGKRYGCSSGIRLLRGPFVTSF
ncbi:hypothetical protein Tco_0493235 [Tanacetum coccineum]